MKSLFLAAALTALPFTAVQADDLQQRADESRAIAMKFGKALKGELQKAMKSDGPVAAIDVCYQKAPAIAEQLSTETGWQVHRTSLKPRKQAPDAWEIEVLKRFDERRAAGEDPKTIEFYEVTEVDGKPAFRYMKALGTAPLCLTCHGQDIPEGVQAKLNTLYPNDQAVGYEAGQIRGAFTIVQPM